MNVNQALRRANRALLDVSPEEAALAAEVLLRHVLKLSRVGLKLSPERELSLPERELFAGHIDRRRAGEPVAYITQQREFYSRDYYVDRRVLIPRPETELLVDKAIEFMRHRDFPVIADIGTGSGAIAVSLALALPRARLYAVDISRDALDIAGVNCRRYGVTQRVNLYQGDLLEPLPGPIDLIAANLPYVKYSDLASIDTTGFEPALALDGGADGLDLIRRLVGNLGGKLKPGGALLLEVGCGQSAPVIGLLRAAFPAGEIAVFPDLAGIERVVAFCPASNLILQGTGRAIDTVHAHTS